MIFSEKLIALRRKRGLSQEQLASLVGVTRQSVSKWESGQVQPEIPKLVALSECFEVSVDYLVKDNLEEPDAGPRELSQLEARVDDIDRRIDTSIYAYTSRARLFGLPLLSVRFGRQRYPDRNNTAFGIIAVGNFAVGVVAVGLICLGLLSVGMVAFGLLLALGGVSVGTVAVGISAVGVFAYGAAAAGLVFAAGVDAAKLC